MMMRWVFLISLSMFCNFSTNAQCIQGNCFNGNGIYISNNGSRYQGEFRNGRFHGQGKADYSNNDSYIGHYAFGKKVGIGKYIYAAGHKYVGDFYNDKRQGKGKITYSNGDIYQGEWKDDSPEGIGSYFFKDGSKYEGQFTKGSFNGMGRYTDSYGIGKDGFWSNNEIHEEAMKTGEPNLLNKEQTLDAISFVNVYSKMDKLPDCTSQYCSEMNGKFKYRDGSNYYGYFVNGEPRGDGVCLYSNGSKYEGSWANHGPDGIGTMILMDNKIVSGRWEKGAIKERIYKEEAIAGINEGKRNNKDKSELNKTEIYAVVVGIASYNTMSSLKYTDDDAYQLYAFLKSPEGGALKDDHIALLIDDGATRKNIATEMGNIFSKADENDLVILYMSGHGLEGSFVPVDFDGINNLFNYSDILEVFNTSSAKHKLLIADACHSGSMYAARNPDLLGVENYYDQLNQSTGGTAIIMSSKKDEVSLEYSGLRQGIFSHYLIRGLKGEADKDNNKYVSVGELFDYVFLNVRHYTANAQTPSIAGDFDINMPVAMVR